MKESVPPSSLGMCCAGIKAASSSRVFVKWILEATTGSSQPFIMFQIPGFKGDQRQTWVIILFRRGLRKRKGIPWKIQGDLWMRTTPRDSG